METLEIAPIPKKLHCPHCGKCEMGRLCWPMFLTLEKQTGYKLKATSGYRCSEHQAALRAAWLALPDDKRKITPEPSENSQHAIGAIDFLYPEGADVNVIVLAARKLGFNGIGVYKRYRQMHIDRRKVPASWGDI